MQSPIDGQKVKIDPMGTATTFLAAQNIFIKNYMLLDSKLEWPNEKEIIFEPFPCFF